MQKRKRLSSAERRFFFTLYLSFIYALRISDLQFKNILECDISKKVISFKTKFSKILFYKLDPTLINLLKKHNLKDLLLPTYSFRREVKKKWTIRPHDIRRSRATFIYHQSKDITKVQECLGHSSPSSSWLYVKRLTDQEPVSVSI